MSTDFQSTGGVDVHLEVSPDTPAAHKRIQHVLGYFDELANALSTVDTDWTVALTIGGIPIVTVTATPADHERNAA